MKKPSLAILGALLLATAAYADFFEGTIIEINQQDNKMAFIRDDNSERIDVQVNDRAALGLVREGSPVRVQAEKDSSGWNATSIQVPKDQLNVPDQRLLQTAEYANYNFANQERQEGTSANESLSNHSRPGAAGGSEISVRQRAAY